MRTDEIDGPQELKLKSDFINSQVFPIEGPHVKRFDDANDYDADIATVLPAHRLVRELAMSVLVDEEPQRILVVGSGPGQELVELATLLPRARILAVDRSQAMVESARTLVGQAGFASRIEVVHAGLDARPIEPVDAAVSLFVAHFVPDDGAREQYWADLAASLAPGGCLVSAEIRCQSVEERDLWLAWSALKGCGDYRLTRLDERLSGGFAVVSEERTRELAASAGLRHERTLCAVLGVVLDVWRAPLTKNP